MLMILKVCANVSSAFLNSIGNQNYIEKCPEAEIVAEVLQI